MKIKLLALLSLFCFAAQGAFASTPVAYEIMGVKYRLNTDGTAEVYKCDEKRQGDVKIESTLVSDGSKWTTRTICESAFAECRYITSVTIPNTVTSIERAAFSYTKLTSINIPNSVKNIGAVAFSFCENLSTVTIPSSVTSIGDFAFSDCGNLKTVNIYNAENVLLSPSEYHPCPFERVSAECVLYVPESIREQYEATAYNDCFSIILGMTDEMLDIENAVKADGMAKEKDRFDLRGNKLDAPQRGINIVRMSDGTVKKVFVK